MTNIDEIDKDFRKSLKVITDLYGKALKMQNRGYSFSINPYIIGYHYTVSLGHYGYIGIRDKKKTIFGEKEVMRTLVIFDAHENRYFDLNKNPYTFYYPSEAYIAIEKIAEMLVAQLKVVDSTLINPGLSTKIEKYSEEFNNILKQLT